MTQNTQKPQDLIPEGDMLDMLDDTTRRELLRRIAQVGASAVPMSLVLLDEAKAQATGSTGGFAG